MKKIVNIIALLTLSASLATAQMGIKINWNDAGYIFEGQIIKIESYSHPLQDDMLFTSNIIKVNRVFKGELKPGDIVDLVTSGAITFDSKGQLSGRSIPLEAEFGLNLKGTFFCYAPVKGNIVENPRTILYKRLRLIDKGESIISYDQDYQYDPRFISGKYATRQDFYNSLKAYTGVSIPQNGFDPEFDKNIFENIKKPEPPVLKSTQVQKEPIDTQAIYRQTEEYMRLQRIWFDSIRSANRSKKKISLLKAVATATICKLTLANAQLSAQSAAERYFEFDVCIQASEAATYLNNVQFVLQFNTSAFGSSLFTNKVIEVTPTGCFAGDYTFTYAADKTTNQVLLHLYVKNTVAGFAREEVPAYATGKAEPMAHVKIKIKTCGKNTSLALVDATNTCASYTSAAEKQVPLPNLADYSGFDIGSQLNKNTCELTIADLSPKQATAGTHDGSDIIVIKGSGFGATRVAPYLVGGIAPRGEVMFKNADSANHYLPYLDSIDYLSWKDDEIRLQVPSVVRWEKSKDNWVELIPGSCLFKVRNYMGDEKTSAQPNYLDIVYSCINAASLDINDIKITKAKYRVNLAKWNKDTTADIKFVVGQNLAVNNRAMACVEKALAAWSCEIGINLLLVRDNNGNVVTSTKAKESDPEPRNVIYFDSELGGRALMQCLQAKRICNDYGYGRHPTIGISTVDTSKWFYDGTGTMDKPGGKFDFYATLLHELGHALLLNHVIDANRELMYYSAGPDYLSANQRTHLTSSRAYNGSYPSIMGVNNIIAASKHANYGDNCGNDTIYPLIESRVKVCGVQVIPNIQSPTLFQGNAFNLPYYVTGEFYAGNVFTVELSDATGSFGDLKSSTASTATVIGTLAATGSGTIPCKVPASVQVGTGYKIRIVSSNPVSVSAASSLPLTVVPAGAALYTGSLAQTTFCAGAQVTVPYTFANLTFASGNVFTVQLSNASGSFASPVAIGTLGSTAEGAVTATLPAGTVSGEGYRVRVVSSNPQLTAADNGANITIHALPAKPTITANGPTTFCEGGSVTLTSSAASAYTWSPGGAATQSITVTATGSYSVIVAADNGCMSSASNAVTVTVNPIVPLTASITCNPANLICPDGSNITFTAQANNGSSAVTYQWKLNGNNVGANSATYSSNSLVAGNIIQYTVTATNGCFSNNPAYSNTVTMANASVAYPSIDIKATPRFIDVSNNPAPEDIQWTNKVNCTTTGTSIKLSNTNASANIVQQISEGGYIEGAVPYSAHRLLLRIGTAPNYEFCFRAVVFRYPDCVYSYVYIEEPGFIRSNYYEYSMLRIAIIQGKVCFFNNNVLLHVSNNSIATPANARVEIYSNPYQAERNEMNNMQIKKSGPTFAFDAVTANAGPNPAYQWKVNNVWVGGPNSPQYTYPPILNPGDLVSCLVTSSNYCNQTATANYQLYSGAIYPEDYTYNSADIFTAPYSFQACRNIEILANVNIESSQILNFYAGNEINIGNGTDSDFEIGTDATFEIAPCTSQYNSMANALQGEGDLELRDFEDENTAVSVYPNPASGQIFVRFRQKETTDHNVSVLSITGLKLSETGHFRMAEGTKTIDISGLSSGVYILHIEANGEVTKRKIIVK